MILSRWLEVLQVFYIRAVAKFFFSVRKPAFTHVTTLSVRAEALKQEFISLRENYCDLRSILILDGHGRARRAAARRRKSEYKISLSPR